MNRQSPEAQKGEIRFRRLLDRQQVTGEVTLEDEFDSEGIRNVLQGRMEDTRRVLADLKARGVAQSPYLEVGAERGQRSLIAENDIGLSGIAADISFDMLKSARHYAREFGKSNLPMRIVCDIYTLPFRSGSLPFVFCWETLHHFPTPVPVVQELHRVLAPGGYFYFDEEPYLQVLRLPLYKSSQVYHQVQRGSLARRLVDRFFSTPSCNETDYGILENHSIPLAEWNKALSVFDERDVTLRTVRGIQSRPENPPDPIKHSIAYLLGGSIQGLCRKAGRSTPVSRAADALICPQCLLAGREEGLVRFAKGSSCAACGTRYGEVDGVLFLLTRQQLHDLYPDIEETLAGSVDLSAQRDSR